MGQLLGHQEALVRPDAPDQRPLQLRELLPQPPPGELGQRGGVGLPGDQRGQHVPPRLAQDVGGHRGELDVGAFQGLLQPVDLRRPLADQARPVAGQLAQLPLRPVGDEAAREQPVPEQVGHPLAVADVGLAPGHRLDVPGVDQQQLELVLQQVPDRLPVDAGALHRHVGHPVRRQPVRQRQDVGGHRPEGPDLLAGRPRRAR